MAQNGNIGNNGAKVSTLPKAVDDDAIARAVYKAVRRAISGLESKIEAKRPRTIVEKNYKFDVLEFTKVHLALRQECDRSAALLAELRAEREKILRIIKPEMFT